MCLFSMILSQDAWLNYIATHSSEVGMYQPCTPQMPNTVSWCAPSTLGACSLAFFLKIQPVMQTKGKRWYFFIGGASHFSKWNQLCAPYSKIMFLNGQLHRNHPEEPLSKQILRLKPRPIKPKSLGPGDLHFKQWLRAIESSLFLSKTSRKTLENHWVKRLSQERV